MFPAVFRKTSTAGYCEVENVDLGKFSSNQDICHSSLVKASEEKICARYTWLIDNFAPSTFRFKHNGENIQYKKTAIYVGDELVVDGGRDVIQEFEIDIETNGMHKIEVFGFENSRTGIHRNM